MTLKKACLHFSVATMGPPTCLKADGAAKYVQLVAVTSPLDAAESYTLVLWK